MRRFTALSLALALALLSLSACAKAPSPFSFRESAQTLDLPVGSWYESAAAEWDGAYLPDALAEVFFGTRPDYPWVLYLGADDGVLCEILYAEAPSDYEALLLCERLSARVDLLSRLAADSFGESLKGARVMRRGNCVLYSVCPVNDEVAALFH